MKEVNKIWDKVFGFKIGDKVKIVEVWDKGILRYEARKSLIGKIGVIVDERICYRGNSHILYVDASRSHPIPIHTYSVKLETGTSWAFAESDLERIEE